jgi:hypothetical protein
MRCRRGLRLAREHEGSRSGNDPPDGVIVGAVYTVDFFT